MLVVREPLHLGHLRIMTEVTEYGAVVLPPCLASTGEDCRSDR